MAVDLDLWKKNVWSAASGIGDKEYQRLAWIEHDKRYVSSPDEMWNILFDDANIELFLSHPNVCVLCQACVIALCLVSGLRYYVV